MTKVRITTHKALRIALLAALIIIFGVIANFILFAVAAMHELEDLYDQLPVDTIAESLVREDSEYALPIELKEKIDSIEAWAMLIDDNGDVAWNYNKPIDIAEHFTVSDVAAFGRWYLNDYPIQTWNIDSGLFVLAYPIGSVWQYPLSIPMTSANFFFVWAPAAIVINFLIILFATYFVVRGYYRKRDSARAEWIAAVSHDIRTPLSLIVGYASELESEASLTDADRQKTAAIQTNGKKVAELISNLNLTNKLEYAMEPVEFRAVAMAPLIRQIAAEFINEDVSGSYPLDVEISDLAMGVYVYGDEALLRRMLSNLVVNTKRNNPLGCGITIKLDLKGHSCVLEVSDDGCGLTPEQIRIFNQKQFNSLPEHGFGHIIVNRIIQAHRGKVIFSNNLNGGCTCIVRLAKTNTRKS